MGNDSLSSGLQYSLVGYNSLAEHHSLVGYPEPTQRWCDRDVGVGRVPRPVVCAEGHLSLTSSDNLPYRRQIK